MLSSCLGAINLLVFSLYIVSFDKKLYVELGANEYKCLIGFLWRCRDFVLAQVHCIVDLIVGICLFTIGVLCLLFFAIFSLNFNNRIVRVLFSLGCIRFARFFSPHYKS